jgi:hypothetical protein
LFDAWDAETEENERLHPGIHDRLFEKLLPMYPGQGGGPFYSANSL